MTCRIDATCRTAERGCEIHACAAARWSVSGFRDLLPAASGIQATSSRPRLMLETALGLFECAGDSGNTPVYSSEHPKPDLVLATDPETSESNTKRQAVTRF